MGGAFRGREPYRWGYFAVIAALAIITFFVWFGANRKQNQTTADVMGLRQQVCTNVRTVRAFLDTASYLREVTAAFNALERQQHLADLNLAADAYWRQLADNLVQPSCVGLDVFVPPIPPILLRP